MNARKAGRRHIQTPPITASAVQAARNTTASATYAGGGVSAAVCARWLCAKAALGQPLWISQPMFGSNRTNAIPVAIHGPRVFSTRRCGVSASPATSASSIVTIVYLASRPMPAITPTAGHSRGIGRVTATSTR